MTPHIPGDHMSVLPVILIVEDEESIAELEKDYLELSGFEVEIENDGEEGQFDRRIRTGD